MAWRSDRVACATETVHGTSGARLRDVPNVRIEQRCVERTQCCVEVNDGAQHVGVNACDVGAERRQAKGWARRWLFRLVDYGNGILDIKRQIEIELRHVGGHGVTTLRGVS